jgi:transmembrane 9 superfamily protein 2/4
MIVLALMWFGISIPLVSLGAYRGFVSNDAIDNPVDISSIPRYIPKQETYMHPVVTCLFGGILPFGAIFIETYFIMSSVWHYSGFYYLYGFLLLVFLILVVTSAETAIIICYFQLCSEDWKWWWRAFFTSGSSAFYMFAYSIFYFVTQLEITNFNSVLLYFGYMWIVCVTLFLMTGTVGFLSCFVFIRRIYASIKVD